MTKQAPQFQVKTNIISRGTSTLAKGLLPWLVPILLLSIWQITSMTGLLQSRILPAPSAVVSAFWHLLLSGELWQHVKVSAGRALSGACMTKQAPQFQVKTNIISRGTSTLAKGLLPWLVPILLLQHVIKQPPNM